jgi:hypothetical protein
MSVSAATSVQEVLPLEEANPCNFLVLYEDGSARDLAMAVCHEMMTRFEAELPFAFSFWQLKDLRDPVSAHWAAESVTRADILLFSLSGRDLTPEISQWLETCASARTKTEGALALVVAESREVDTAFGTLLSRMQFAAYRLHMDFLPPFPGRESGPVAAPLGADDFREDPGSDHWGLNE